MCCKFVINVCVARDVSTQIPVSRPELSPSKTDSFMGLLPQGGWSGRTDDTVVLCSRI